MQGFLIGDELEINYFLTLIEEESTKFVKKFGPKNNQKVAGPGQYDLSMGE
jgi:hypothetical protein